VWQGFFDVWNRMTPEAWIMLAFGVAGAVTAFATFAAMLRTHLTDCAAYRARQEKALAEFTRCVSDIKSQLDRLVGRMEYEERREEYTPKLRPIKSE
jgi:hypothetical protein